MSLSDMRSRDCNSTTSLGSQCLFQCLTTFSMTTSFQAESLSLLFSRTNTPSSLGHSSENRTGPKPEPWGTSLVSIWQLDVTPFPKTLWAWSHSQFLSSKEHTHPSHEELVSRGECCVSCLPHNPGTSYTASSLLCFCISRGHLVSWSSP